MISVAVIALGWWGTHVCKALSAGSINIRIVRGVDLEPESKRRSGYRDRI